MSSFRTISILTFVVTSLLLYEECSGENNQRRRQRNRNNLQRQGDGLPSDLQEAYQNAVEGHNTPSTQSGGNQNEDEPIESENARSNGWEDLAPSTPASNAIECTVEIYTMRRLGGRCSRLGGLLSRPYICQSGQHFAFDSDCERIIAGRNGRNPES